MQPLIWLGILALLLVVEAITAGLTTIWFAGGALAAAIACYAGANLTVQILLFLCVSLVLLIFTGNEVLQQRNHTDQCKQSDWKESSCDSGD